ncbi:hypothetical protein [Halopiger xanaduensis]|uniref:Uncharacterized protein n=1 Tax=Halopiger xanaduensis (strain DSM 18323 / JCM 14033 / SH-6) TaxID=797210 RepID=F8D417_HALXS|nr:hypothetical protein [Halopiger xanaduensis]AEH36270.1 hypothetical protein Halxa_1638 [Halopiger xanaduensis SH-6]
MGIREKVLSTDWDEWNHPRRAILFLVLVAGVAGGIASAVLKLVPGPRFVGIVVASFCAGAIVLIAGTILAAVD